LDFQVLCLFKLKNTKPTFFSNQFVISAQTQHLLPDMVQRRRLIYRGSPYNTKWVCNRFIIHYYHHNGLHQNTII